MNGNGEAKTSSAMAPSHPLSPAANRAELKLPMPPPLLHTRSGNAIYNEGPHTPIGHGFTTPIQTPQGSPSKNRVPPGANDLPSVFDNAMKLFPSSPTKAGRQQLSPHSPNKGAGRTANDDVFDTSVLHQDIGAMPGSPLRKSNKENTPPSGRLGKDAHYSTNQAAMSRQEQYQTRGMPDTNERARYSPTRGLTSEELEKLSLPKVKRLANVTQLCKVDPLSLPSTR